MVVWRYRLYATDTASSIPSPEILLVSCHLVDESVDSLVTMVFGTTNSQRWDFTTLLMIRL